MKMAPTADPFSSSPGDPWVMRVFLDHKQDIAELEIGKRLKPKQKFFEFVIFI
jgi:hypothetical protein